MHCSQPHALALLLSVVGVTAAAEDAATRVSFRGEVIPALTRAGCNAGTCHGSPSGKNGFALSLRGYLPDQDFNTLTHQAQGRRLDRLQPDASLMLLKATAEIPHEGGRRFEKGSALHAILRNWIAQGAQDDATVAPPLEHLEAQPAHSLLVEPATSEQVRVIAHFAGGVRRDVSHLARFSVNDEAVATVSLAGQVERKQNGEAVIIAEYLGQMAVSKLVFLARSPGFVWQSLPEHNYIDAAVFAKLRRLQIEPSPLSSDWEFLRRIHLDAIGKLPTPAEVRAFLADRMPDKREQWIDRLLERPEYADWWALKWSDRLGCNQRFVGKIGAVKYHQWIRDAMVRNVPEDEFARMVLTGLGGNYSQPAAGYYRRLRDPQVRAEETAQLFLGVRLGCAKCHNHPGERWTQDDYHGLAAFFAQVRYKDGPFFIQLYDKEETVYLDRSLEVEHPRTGAIVAPRFLGGFAATLSPRDDRREAFARWLTSSSNPYFARAAANRIWFHLLGRGVVDPVDDLRSTNPPSNEELLAALTEDFVKHNFDRKHLIRTILRSRTYQLGSQTTATNAADDKYFSHARVRLLQAEQMLDAVASATGVPEKFTSFPLGTSAVALPDGEHKHPFLEVFGRPARAMACECERESDTNLGQALHLIGGRVVHDKIRSDSARVANLLAQGRSDAQVIDELFLATLARFPDSDERRVLLARFAKAPDRRRQTAEDLLWALVNHREFMFQH